MTFYDVLRRSTTFYEGILTLESGQGV